LTQDRATWLPGTTSTNHEATGLPSAEDWREAWAAYREGRFGQAGLVDQVSFLVMRRLSISQAFTNDRHFRAAGFETLF
jgi:predicted nucleic acid-binding protein